MGLDFHSFFKPSHDTNECRLQADPGIPKFALPDYGASGSKTSMIVTQARVLHTTCLVVVSRNVNDSSLKGKLVQSGGLSGH